MSRGVNIQFHARDTECVQLVKECCQEFGLKLLLVQYSPTLKVRKVDECADLLSEINSLGNGYSRVFIFSLYDFIINTKNSSELDKVNPTTLSLTLGRELDNCIGESWLCSNYFLNDVESSKTWQKVSRKLKKITKAGAWAENTKTGGRQYYRNHRYTEGAKLAQSEGFEMMASIGHIIHDFLTPKPDGQ